MTAEDARRLTTEARTPDNGQVQVMVETWRMAITRAARAGRSSVRETELSWPRMRISEQARAAALAQLGRDGFQTRVVPDDPSTTVIEVAW